MRITSITLLAAAISGCATQYPITYKEVPVTSIRGHSCVAELASNRVFSLCPPVKVEFQDGHREWLPIYSEGAPDETVVLRCTSKGQCLDEAMKP